MPFLVGETVRITWRPPRGFLRLACTYGKITGLNDRYAHASPSYFVRGKIFRGSEIIDHPFHLTEAALERVNQIE